MVPERRKQNRHSVRVEVVLDDDRRFRCGATIDLSREGALVEGDEPAELGARVALIPLIETSALALELPATVVRVERLPHSGTYQMALALDVRGEQSRAVEEICARA